MRYSEHYNPDWPETKKFEISFVDNQILADQIFKKLKKYCPGKMRYSAVFGKLLSDL